MKKLLILMTLSIFSPSVADDAQDAATLRRQAATQAQITAPQKIQTGQQISNVNDLITVIKQFFLALIEKLKNLFATKPDVIKNLETVEETVQALNTADIKNNEDLANKVTEIHTTLINVAPTADDKIAILSQEEQDEQFAQMLDSLDPELRESILAGMEKELTKIQTDPSFSAELTPKVDSLRNDFDNQLTAAKEQAIESKVNDIINKVTNEFLNKNYQIIKDLDVDAQIKYLTQRGLGTAIRKELALEAANPDNGPYVDPLVDKALQNLASKVKITLVNFKTAQDQAEQAVVKEVEDMLNSKNFEDEVSDRIDAFLKQNVNAIKDIATIYGALDRSLVESLLLTVYVKDGKSLLDISKNIITQVANEGMYESVPDNLSLSSDTQKKIADLFANKVAQVLETHESVLRDKIQPYLSDITTDIESRVGQTLENPEEAAHNEIYSKINSIIDATATKVTDLIAQGIGSEEDFMDEVKSDITIGLAKEFGQLQTKYRLSDEQLATIKKDVADKVNTTLELVKNKAAADDAQIPQEDLPEMNKDLTEMEKLIKLLAALTEVELENELVDYMADIPHEAFSDTQKLTDALKEKITAEFAGEKNDMVDNIIKSTKFTDDEKIQLNNYLESKLTTAIENALTEGNVLDAWHALFNQSQPSVEQANTLVEAAKQAATDVNDTIKQEENDFAAQLQARLQAQKEKAKIQKTSTDQDEANRRRIAADNSNQPTDLQSVQPSLTTSTNAPKTGLVTSVIPTATLDQLRSTAGTRRDNQAEIEQLQAKLKDANVPQTKIDDFATIAKQYNLNISDLFVDADDTIIFKAGNKTYAIKNLRSGSPSLQYADKVPLQATVIEGTHPNIIRNIPTVPTRRPVVEEPVGGEPAHVWE